MRLTSIPPAKLTFIEHIICNFFEDKAEFLRIGVESLAGRPAQHIKLTTGIQIEISCDEIPVYGSEGFTGEIRRFLQAAAYVVGRFESAFPTS